MRTVSAEMEAHLASGSLTLATMLRLDMVNGGNLCLTDHDLPLTFNLGEGAAEYLPWTGISTSDVVLTTGFEASNFEVTGPVSELVTRAAVMGGRYRNAVARLFFVNWDDLTMGSVKIMRGRVTDTRVEGSRFIFGVRGAMDAYNQTWGRVLTPYCSAEYGDSLCTVVRTPHPCEVLEVTDAFRFRVDLGGDHVDDWFNLGTTAFLTGDLAGTEETRVFDYEGATGWIELYEPMIVAPEVGDTLNIYRGCSKLMLSDDPSLPTCLTNNNGLNFRGWKEVPGNRFYHKVSAPGSTYD